MNEHYKQHTIEAIDVIHDWDLGFNLGNAVKYISRYKHKGSPIEDLEKAVWYIEHHIKLLKKVEEAATWDNAFKNKAKILDEITRESEEMGLYENTITGTTHLG